MQAGVHRDCNSTEKNPYHDVFSGYCKHESLGVHSDTENQHKDSNFRVAVFYHDSCRHHDVARKGKKEDPTNEAVRLSVNTDILPDYNALNKICALLFVP